MTKCTSGMPSSSGKNLIRKTGNERRAVKVCLGGKHPIARSTDCLAGGNESGIERVEGFVGRNRD